jgi:hypothetical protein
MNNGDVPRKQNPSVWSNGGGDRRRSSTADVHRNTRGLRAERGRDRDARNDLNTTTDRRLAWRLRSAAFDFVARQTAPESYDSPQQNGVEVGGCTHARVMPLYSGMEATFARRLTVVVVVGVNGGVPGGITVGAHQNDRLLSRRPVAAPQQKASSRFSRLFFARSRPATAVDCRYRCSSSRCCCCCCCCCCCRRRRRRRRR